MGEWQISLMLSREKHNEFLILNKRFNDKNIVKHDFIDMGLVSLPDSINEHNTQKGHYWPPNTCLIVGDSILNNLDESKLA